uniref:PPM-type phosphatase domain-containing protein n=1 Tax=Aplanochytrium stocchinoi TaxID=215587 RepID=A0A7S3V0J1_9STRA|mmetsp:Transcript_17485/g.22273  ORF Transcript_17485/g.22273 Transcript_17485/m.22273 type:complete len:385 (+) Transcript_17485:22-1176(+)
MPKTDLVGFGHHLNRGGKKFQEDGYFVAEDYNKIISYVAEKFNIKQCDDKQKNRIFVALMDGHGGKACMEFVKAVLHHFIAIEYLKGGDWAEAIRTGILKVEEAWIKKATKKSDDGKANISGCTCTVCILEGNRVYCGWLGDSPAWIMSGKNHVVDLTTDHKPNEINERNRIEAAGGEVRSKEFRQERPCCLKPKVTVGPSRVYPGGLAVARAIGDVNCKLKEYGGLPGTVVAEADIKVVDLSDSATYMVLCSDGLSDNITKGRKTAWLPLEQGFKRGYEDLFYGFTKPSKRESVKEYATRLAAESCLETFLTTKDNQDNLSCIVLAFMDRFPKATEFHRKVLNDKSKRPFSYPAELMVISNELLAYFPSSAAEDDAKEAVDAA